MNEVITNALKHAYKDTIKAELSISMIEIENKRIELTVANNGTGLPENFSFDFAETLGMTLIQSDLKQERKPPENLEAARG